MHSTQSYVASPVGSLSTLSSLHGGYIPLSCKKDKTHQDDLNIENGTPKNRVCLSSLFSFLYRFLVAFLRLLCFRLPHNIDNESLLTVEYKNESKGEDLECRLMEDEVPGFVPTRNSVRFVRNNENSPVAKFPPHLHAVQKPKTTAVAVDKIKASQMKGQVIALKGKDQLYKTRIAVSRSKQQLREVQDDILNIRDNIQTAKKLFTEVEKGIQDYKWDSVTREPWASLEYRGEVCYFPMSSTTKYLTPMDQMYIDHRIFVEEMKFHFKWKHGILL